MLISQNEQKSSAWFEERIGLPTASNFKLIVTTKGKRSASAEKYKYQLASEIIKNQKTETYCSADMLRGIALESEARELYELIKNVEVQEVGLCWENEFKKWGASPDGLVGDDGLIEIKCCKDEKVLESIDKDKLPDAYSSQQVQGQLMVSGRLWCDVWIYAQGLPSYCKRIMRDDDFITLLKAELILFCAELGLFVEKIK